MQEIIKALEDKIKEVTDMDIDISRKCRIINNLKDALLCAGAVERALKG